MGLEADESSLVEGIGSTLRPLRSRTLGASVWSLYKGYVSLLTPRSHTWKLRLRVDG